MTAIQKRQAELSAQWKARSAEVAETADTTAERKLEQATRALGRYALGRPFGCKR